MSSPPPTKPPRGVKQGKETSGLLMSVIRTLSASETNEQREKERAKLEKEYKKSDARLDELVAAHAQEIMDVMQKFTAVGAALGSWGQHCEAASARLAACRGLLRLRRDDLRRLWADARTHHYALHMLTDIERVVVSERETREALSSGRVLAAAHTMKTALDTADTTLSHVDALNATRQHLQAKKRELVEVVVRRVSDAVYRGERAPLSRRMSARRRTALLLAELTKSEELTDAYLQDITPEYEASLSEDDKTFETTVMISLEALGVLEQLKEATEKFKVNIQNELLEVIDSVSRRIIEEGDVEPDPECEEDGEIVDNEGVTEMGRPLARLVTSLEEEFRACAARNKRLLQLWKASLQKYRVSDSSLHTEQHYWSAVQQVLQLLLTEYLEIESVPLSAQRSNTVPEGTGPVLRITDYFAKKRPQRQHTKLFRFSACGPVVTTSTRRHAHPLVCSPHASHLHAVLPLLHSLCQHIESITGGGECSLRAFITDYVRTGESERLASAARAAIDEAMRTGGAWRERGPPPTTNIKSGERHRVIFTCCGASWRAISAAVVCARRCGACGGACAARGALGAVHALCAAARAAPPARASAAPAARAARWLADDDIVRFLRSLHNYRAADVAPKDDKDAQELKQAYEREAEILGSSLGDGAIARKEIVADINTLDDLAVMCETMDWLSANIRSIPSMLSGAVKLTEKFVSDIAGAASAFDDIAQKCLLFLHLEMRIECFHYLGQEEREARRRGAPGARAAARARARRARARAAPARVHIQWHRRDDVCGGGVALAGRGRGRRAGRGGAARDSAPLPRRAAPAARRAAPSACVPTPADLHPRGNNNISERERRAVHRAGILERVQSDRRATRHGAGGYETSPQTTLHGFRTCRRHCIDTYRLHSSSSSALSSPSSASSSSSLTVTSRSLLNIDPPPIQSDLKIRLKLNWFK